MTPVVKTTFGECETTTILSFYMRSLLVPMYKNIFPCRNKCQQPNRAVIPDVSLIMSRPINITLGNAGNAVGGRVQVMPFRGHPQSLLNEHPNYHRRLTAQHTVQVNKEPAMCNFACNHASHCVHLGFQPYLLFFSSAFPWLSRLWGPKTCGDTTKTQ